MAAKQTKMVIQMKTISAGPEGSFQPGQKLRAPGQISLEQARLFVRAGAVEIDEPKVEKQTATSRDAGERETRA